MLCDVPINVAEWAQENPKQAQALISGTTSMTRQDGMETLSQMGEVMSLFKLNRKMAVTKAFLDLDEDVWLTAADLATYVNKHIHSRHALTPTSIGRLALLCVKWGIAEYRSDGPSGLRRYARV